MSGASSVRCVCCVSESRLVYADGWETPGSAPSTPWLISSLWQNCEGGHPVTQLTCHWLQTLSRAKVSPA